MNLIYQSLVLAISFSLVYVWQSTTLSLYTIPLLGFLIFLYLITFARKRDLSFLTKGGGLLQIFTLNTLILLLIFATDGFNSPIFFLLYFLGFGIAFAFKPASIFTYTIGLILVFLPLALKDNVTSNFIKLGVLALVSPLAYFFAQMYQREEDREEELEQIQERAKESADLISANVGDVLRSEEKTLKAKDVEKLNQILEETEDLRQEAK